MEYVIDVLKETLIKKYFKINIDKVEFYLYNDGRIQPKLRR